MSDRYDDLDDILDDFEEQDKVLGPSASSEKPKEESKVAEPKPEAPKAEAPQLDGHDEEFAKMLGRGMDDMTASLKNDPNAKAELEALMASLGINSEEPKKPVSFEDTISQTVNRLNESKQSVGDNLGGGDDFIEKMLNDLQNAASGNGDMDSLLSTLMEELSSKDVLYDPLKELHTKYPQWLEKNADKVSKEELSRYKEQQSVIAEIMAKFDDPKYSDDDAETRKFITEKMNQMQETGAPPEDLVGGLAEGALPGADMFGGGGAGGAPPECPVQ